MTNEFNTQGNDPGNIHRLLTEGNRQATEYIQEGA